MTPLAPISRAKLLVMVLTDHDTVNSVLKLWIEQRRARLRDGIIQYEDEDQAHASLAALKAAEDQLLDKIARVESQVDGLRAMLEADDRQTSSVTLPTFGPRRAGRTSVTAWHTFCGVRLQG